MMTHRVFLAWLIYFVTVVLIGIGLCLLRLPQLAIASDHSYLTGALLALYGIAEGLSARQAWRLSREHGIAQATSDWLDRHTLRRIDTHADGVVLHAWSASFAVPQSETARYLTALCAMSNRQPVDQSILLDVLTDRLHAPTSTVEVIAARVVWVGILATILGVIMAFWPLLSAGMAVEVIRAKLGLFFAGIAVAFIPTAASFVFKIALDVSSKILNAGAADIVNVLALAGETKALPMLAAVRDASPP